MTAVLPARAPRPAASPYARRLARERQVSLGIIAGSGPGGRIVAADVVARTASISPPQPQVAAPRATVIVFSATVRLASLCHLMAEAERVGLEIAIEDVATKAALSVTTGGVAVEAGGRQVMVCAAAGLSVGAMRRQRLAAMEQGADAAAEPAAASLLVLHSARVVPGFLPPFPGRALRLGLVIDRDTERGHAILCADADAMSDAMAFTALEGFAAALEQPLILLA